MKKSLTKACAARTGARAITTPGGVLMAETVRLQELIWKLRVAAEISLPDLAEWVQRDVKGIQRAETDGRCMLLDTFVRFLVVMAPGTVERMEAGLKKRIGAMERMARLAGNVRQVPGQ